MQNLEVTTQEAVKVAEKDANDLAGHSRIVVNSQPTFDKAKDQLVEVKRIKKNVKEKKDSIIKPLLEATKNARALFKPVEDKIATIENFLNDGVLKYNQKLIDEQKKREEDAARELQKKEDEKIKAQEKADKLAKEAKAKEEAGQEVSDKDKDKLKEAETEANKDIDVSKITNKLENTTEKIEQIKTRKVKKFKLIDVNKVPREYMMVNETAIRRAMMEGIEVEGIEFYEENIAVNSY